MFIHPLLLWFCQRQKQHIVWMDSGSRNLSRPFSPKGVESLPILSKRQIFLRFGKWVQIRMEPSDFGFWWNFERKFDGSYLLAKSANYLYLPPSTVKQEKLEIVLSLIGHVGSNPTISANKRHQLRLVPFLRLDGADENRAAARRPQATSPAGCCLARGRISTISARSRRLHFETGGNILILDRFQYYSNLTF